MDVDEARGHHPSRGVDTLCRFCGGEVSDGRYPAVGDPDICDAGRRPGPVCHLPPGNEAIEHRTSRPRHMPGLSDRNWSISPCALACSPAGSAPCSAADTAASTISEMRWYPARVP